MSIGANLIALYVKGDNVTDFDSFELNTFRKKLKTLKETKISQQLLIEYK